MHKVTRPPVGNADWLKTIAIISVSLDYIGHFFMEDVSSSLASSQSDAAHADIP
jgi:hypothetical protein